MASGLGKRFGSNKLLADFMGQPMIQRILDNEQGLFGEVVVVTRHSEVAEICDRQGIRVVLHDCTGREDTIRLGMEAIGRAVETCIFCPSDQPLLRRESLIRLAQAAVEDKESFYRVAWGETVGTPAAFPAWSFPELTKLPHGKGGSFLLKRYPERVKQIQAGGPEELRDADTREDLEELTELWKRLFSAKEADVPPNWEPGH